MQAKFTLGQYNYENSILHRLDPRVKIILIFSVVIFLFFVKTITGYLILFAFSVFLVVISKSRFSAVMRSMRPILFLLVFTAIFQVFFTPGRTIYQWHFLKVTAEGVRLAAYISIRLILLSFFTFVLTSTTSGIELTDGFESVISPLKVFRFPAEEVSLMISISLRFVPVLFEEADRIMKAQMSRGAEFNKGNLLKRARGFLPLLLPLLLNALNRADKLAVAMEARGYVIGRKRTKYREVRVKRVDYFAIFITAIVMVVSIAVKEVV
ncbi:MAG: energy-coupling factor transporter transmembrane protein EcfT [Nitrospiraceae bacterium]|nr:energy-coupling factor transporter transmembrane protein EcfT [Nitrospiraceae bacterium]